MIIRFNPKAPAISDYEIENFYNDNKDKDEISISNYSVLSRFRLGVKEGEIDKIELFTTDLDGKEVEARTNEQGLMDNWDAEVLRIYINTTMKLI